MKVVDLLKERKLLKRRYFNNCASLIEPDDYASAVERNQAKEDIIKRHAEIQKALDKYNELSEMLHISNANTYIEVMGYRLSVASALECLRSIKPDSLTYAFATFPPPDTILQHPISTYLDMTNVSREGFDSENWLDPVHVIKDDVCLTNIIGIFAIELEYAIMKSNCATEI